MRAGQSFVGKPRVERLLACFCFWNGSAFVVQLTDREAVRRFTQQDKRYLDRIDVLVLPNHPQRRAGRPVL